MPIWSYLYIKIGECYRVIWSQIFAELLHQHIHIGEPLNTDGRKTDKWLNDKWFWFGLFWFNVIFSDISAK